MILVGPRDLFIRGKLSHLPDCELRGEIPLSYTIPGHFHIAFIWETSHPGWVRSHSMEGNMKSSHINAGRWGEVVCFAHVSNQKQLES